MGRRTFQRDRLAVSAISIQRDPPYRSCQSTTARIDQANIAFAGSSTRWGVIRRLGNRGDVFRTKEFQHQMDSKFSEIAQLIGKQLGYNSGDERANDEADVAITYWSEHLESANSKVQARTPLQRLLQEYHMIIDRFIAGL
jgi:hypothetical protein